MDVISKVQWRCKEFSQLTGSELYDVLKLRNEVFVVEQHCVYQDCDDKDKSALHLTGHLGEKLVAYSRLLPVGISYKDGTSIGRVITAPSVRGMRFGKTLMDISIQKLYEHFGYSDIIISAQAHLQEFYKSFGFVSEGKKYLEDDIPHVKMRKACHVQSQ